MEIYADVYNQRLRVKCHYCGRENSIYIPVNVGALDLGSVSTIAGSLAE